MRLEFAKMQALGNDFVVLNGLEQPLRLSAEQCRMLADRRRGVGCDQILVVDPAPVEDVDFGYRIFNADGSEVGQCGNGARCLARFVARRELSHAQHFTVATQTTRMRLDLLDDGWVRAELAAPEFNPQRIPLAREQQALTYRIRCRDGDIEGGAVSMGNPHFVIPVDAVATAPVEQLGAELERHGDFPEGVNVGFVEQVARDQLSLRVFERGVGETPACGSGACAAAVLMRMWEKTADQVEILLPGGHLRVDWAPGRPVLLEGPADWVFEGEIEI